MDKEKKMVVFHNAIEYMEEHISERMKVSVLAEHCGVSASWIEKMFKKCVSKGAKRYFLDMKLEHAAKMIKKGFSCNEIAAQLSFSSSAHLSMAFKKKYGVSPLKYKYQ